MELVLGYVPQNPSLSSEALSFPLPHQALDQDRAMAFQHMDPRPFALSVFYHHMFSINQLWLAPSCDRLQESMKITLS
jgi:hypothetical protein